MLRVHQYQEENRVRVYASAPTYFQNGDPSATPIMTLGEHSKKQSLAKINGRPLDYSWLRGASETYQISDKIEDYVITEVPIVTVGYPNRNLHAFPYQEVTYFDPKFGKFVYQTFQGKPTFADHKNQNFVEAKGVHFDSSLRKVPGWNVWKIYVLLGYCRQKDPVLANKIEKGQRRGYSMGAWVSYFINSITGQISNGTQPLKHPKGTVYNGLLSYDLCTGVDYFETSSVEGPADVSAESHQLWHF